MSLSNLKNHQQILPPLRFESRWEIVRFGLIYILLATTLLLIYYVLFICIDWFFKLLLEESYRTSTVIFATLLTLSLLEPLKEAVRSIIDNLIFLDTANLKDEIDTACRTLTNFNDFRGLKQFLEIDLPTQLKVDKISLTQEEPTISNRYVVTLPLNMGQRSLGYLTVGPKCSGRSFSYEERAILTQLQEQLSLVLSGIQLKEAREAAERVAGIKSEFLTNISHQLRTPLNTVINSTGLVADGLLGAINREQAEYLGRAVQGSEYLLKLLDDILDITKIELGQLRLRLETIDLIVVVEEALPLIKGMLANKPIELKLEIADDLPVVVADRLRTRQILLNLFSNAAKFTKEGMITLKIWRERQWIFTSVIDTGIGIAEEHLSLIFEDYQQITTGQQSSIQMQRRRHLGTGLGMPITKALVELHGGRIWVSSTPGKGSIFTFTLPVNPDRDR